MSELEHIFSSVYALSVHMWCFTHKTRGQLATMVRHLPPTPEVGGSDPGPYVGKLVVAYLSLAVHSTEP